jgi:Anticodon binding domain
VLRSCVRLRPSCFSLPSSSTFVLERSGPHPPTDSSTPPKDLREQFAELSRSALDNGSPAFFDLKKLATFNGEYIRALSLPEFIAACLPLLHAPDVAWPAERFDPAMFAAMAPLVQLRLVTMNDVAGVVDFLFLENPVIDADAWAKTFASPAAAAVLAEVTAEYASLPTWDADTTLSRWRHGFESRWGCKFHVGQSHSAEWLFCFSASVPTACLTGSSGGARVHPIRGDGHDPDGLPRR